MLGQIQRGEETAETSALTFDEVFWVIKKHNLELAFTACEAMLNFPNIDIIPADKGLAVSALQIIRECHLSPRDAVHAATAISGKADFIVSTDAHFSRVKELKWKDLR
jgi:predicted nucleic acid-binding protein